MRKHANTLKEYIKTHKIISVFVLLMVLFVLYKIFLSSGVKKETFVVKKGDVVQKVIVNGKTKAVHAVSLGFESNGRVSNTYVEVGSRVVTGQQLVALDSSETYADYLRAEANLASENAKLDEMQKGTRPEEIAVAQTEVENAKTTLSDAQKNLKDKVLDVLGNNIDQLFSNPHTPNPQINLVLSDSQLKSDINFGRAGVETLINNWDLSNGESNLPVITLLIDNVAKAVNSQSASPSLTQATIDGYKSSLSSAKSTMITYRDALTSAKSSLSLAERNLTLKKSGSTPEAINAEVAKVKQFEADFQSVKAKLAKMTLRSPQNGVVTIQDAKVGEIVTPGKNIISIISDSDLEIDSNVSEVNIGKVAIGNKVMITFDAFPGEVFAGTVTYIEPGETIVDGVVNYKVTVAFSEKYPQMKSGLTSKLEIITGTKTDVVIIPQYSLITKTDGIFVSKQNGKTYSEVPVTVGLRGQDGFVEVLSGLSSSDVIETVSTAQ